MIMILIVMITILIRRAPLRTLLSTLALGLLVVGCGTSDTSDSDALEIVATTSIWGDVVGEIAGDDASVEVLIPVGADTHDYQPTSQDVALLQEADLVIANGLGLEGGLSDVLESATEDGANILELAPELDPLTFGTHGGHEEDGDVNDGEEHGSLDPHVWFDPIRVDHAAQLIAHRLAEVDNSVAWEERADEYSEALLQTDEEISRVLDSVPAARRKLVTNHDALGYFANRYGFQVIAAVIPGGSTLADPSSAEMAALVEEMRSEGVSTIFAETSQPTRLAEAVAAEVGDEVSVVELYTESLGEPGSEAGTLIGMLLTNARRIGTALSG